jgi:nitrogen-specific signal transduction histidine kinase
LLLFAHKQVLVGRTVNLNGVCEDLLELARQTLGATVSVRTAFANDLRDCLVDVGQLEMAVLNIILNARDASSAQPDAQVLVHTDNCDVEKSDLKSLVDLSEGHYVPSPCTAASTRMIIEDAI